jgi:hypothetical protein
MSAELRHEELLALAAAVDWPETPDFAARLELGAVEREQPRAGSPLEWLRARTRRDPAARPWGALRTAVAIGLTVVIAVAAVPPARSAVLELLGLTSGERIVRVPTATLPSSSPRFELGPRTSLDAARGAVDFPVRVPPLLGAPASVHLARTIPGGMVSLAYGDEAVLSQFRGGATRYIQKLVGPDTRVEEVEVDGARGYFISGPPPVVLFEDERGQVVEGRPVLEGSSVLIWDAGGIAHRLELRGGRERALAIARSLR